MNAAMDEIVALSREVHAELAEKAETLQRTADVRARVVANVSHELRTPVHTNPRPVAAPP